MSKEDGKLLCFSIRLIDPIVAALERRARRQTKPTIVDSEIPALRNVEGSLGRRRDCRTVHSLGSIAQMPAAPHVDGFKLAAAKVALCSCSGR